MTKCKVGRRRRVMGAAKYQVSHSDVNTLELRNQNLGDFQESLYLWQGHGSAVSLPLDTPTNVGTNVSSSEVYGQHYRNTPINMRTSILLS